MLNNLIAQIPSVNKPSAVTINFEPVVKCQYKLSNKPSSVNINSSASSNKLSADICSDNFPMDKSIVIYRINICSSAIPLETNQITSPR